MVVAKKEEMMMSEIQTKTERSEIAQKGEAIYEQTLRPLLETEENLGKYLVIDTDSGDYEMDTDRVEAVLRLSRHHNPAHSWHLKIGYTAVGTIGGALQRRAAK